MKRSVHRAVVGLFALSILTLAALMGHWTVLLWRHESAARSKAEQRLQVAAHAAAGRLGQRAQPPPVGPLSGGTLEVVRLGTARPPRLTVRLSPSHVDYGVRPRPAALQQLREKRRRRFQMILGEGALALLLVLVFCVALLRLLFIERQRRQAIETFVSTVSHELKTPLAGIRALLTTLQMGNIPPEKMPDYVDMGLRESDRLEHLVENILIANRIRQSTLAVSATDLELGRFLTEYLEHRNALLPVDHPGVELAGDPPAGEHVRADGDKLRVVLENLTDNAIKYGDGSAVTLDVKLTEDQVTLAVCDEGVGFDPARSEALFEGLRAATRPDTAMTHGTGLGLGIARTLARAMEGEVTAESAGEGQGACFTVVLPRGRAS